ncbi:DUF6232 family protein [Actinoplanes utahensis]|uniref:Uncharacterized protein n=1 Tax=Actinoplanes utahensis TaxID=1869 RepID=A0A0A6UPN6_ACTUT|nr:DUF6232 family protein [Actinoplanes utahensis]KHD77401.1 hypothetical protein MB27_11720 [Actinoplanes utahensis]GIF32834.1 hypothetical protein Aut01nite_58200 [Actinoplanes utahensis]
MPRVYYRSYDAEVTDQLFIRNPGGQPERFAIAEIADFSLTRLDQPWWRLPHRKPSYRLSADYHGRTVVLFESREPRVFNMVVRALRRALENRPRGYH